MALPENIQHDLELMQDADTGRAMKNYICQTTEDLVDYIDAGVSDANEYALEAKSYAEGGTGTREDEDTENAKYYYEKVSAIYSELGGTLLPKGTITFEELPTDGMKPGWMYNISNEFTSDDRFKDGGGKTYASGTDVYWTADSMWDCLAGGLNELEAVLRKDIKESLDAIAANVESAHTDATNAATSEANAKTSETNAKTSETNAKTSETNAKTSETNAKASETNAKASETNAATSETNSAASETAAAGYEESAKEHMDAANLSEENAKKSEENAAESETNAKSSADHAETSKNAATTSETNAKISETNAKISEANAKTSETNAKTSETNASNSETNASLSATLSESYAVGGTGTRENEDTDNAMFYSSSAKVSETNAAASELNAKTSETNAKTSESNAKTSETNAKTSESNTKTSETNAANSAKEAGEKVATIEGKYSDSILYANKAESYAVGNGTREGDSTDNSKYYYKQVKSISQSLSGVLNPMGTIKFSELADLMILSGYMYNISDSFTSDERFKDGGGVKYPAGTNVYVTSDMMFDCLAGTLVTSVNGEIGDVVVHGYEYGLKAKRVTTISISDWVKDSDEQYHYDLSAPYISGGATVTASDGTSIIGMAITEYSTLRLIVTALPAADISCDVIYSINVTNLLADASTAISDEYIDSMWK